ncbi:hypothetical protein ABW20_dc0106305 [Dactylellina cionopaga]|nr:hypothetical protein ABW20_dc0106305 [Dactylellina cionopaga]
MHFPTIFAVLTQVISLAGMTAATPVLDERAVRASRNHKLFSEGRIRPKVFLAHIQKTIPGFHKADDEFEDPESGIVIKRFDIPDNVWDTALDSFPEANHTAIARLAKRTDSVTCFGSGSWAFKSTLGAPSREFCQNIETYLSRGQKYGTYRPNHIYLNEARDQMYVDFSFTTNYSAQDLHNLVGKCYPYLQKIIVDNSCTGGNLDTRGGTSGFYFSGSNQNAYWTVDPTTINCNC